MGDDRTFAQMLAGETCVDVVKNVDSASKEDCREFIDKVAEGDIQPEDFSEAADDMMGDGAFEVIQDTWDDIKTSLV